MCTSPSGLKNSTSPVVIFGDMGGEHYLGTTITRWAPERQQAENL
jgi:hypothetical protein